MDYKEQIAYLRYLEQKSQHIEASAFARAARSIADLLARAETAEAAIEEKEKYYGQMVDALAATDSAELKETKEKLKEAEAKVNELETLHRTEMCEDGWDCVVLGKEREKVKRLEMKIERLKKIMRDSGILVISADGPGRKEEWNLPERD